MKWREEARALIKTAQNILDDGSYCPKLDELEPDARAVYLNAVWQMLEEAGNLVYAHICDETYQKKKPN